eukprot:g44550.t1
MTDDEVTQDMEREFRRVNQLNIEEQAMYFLNAFWLDWGQKNCELMWKWCHDMMEIDLEAWVQRGRKKQHYRCGNALMITFAMKMLEKENASLTPVEYKKQFKKIDADFDGAMSLLEFALYKTNLSVADLVTKPQATTAALEKAKQQLEKAQQALHDWEVKKDELRIRAQTGTGTAALKARQDWEKVCQEDIMPLERQLIRAESAVKRAEKKVPPPPGATWWNARKEEERQKFLASNAPHKNLAGL